ncbi:lysosomal Cystine transporter [Spizellomyces punctatus DAOM BR117]|uniref:Lysosomal Cystine transporter n=1 Tax=Spizellomyces punctatus (strain DAOM BR117) TaxID=645134 RepID=A0A0L0HHS9_SPIPD|nr:lysosomal Cystine transporter [Spizellomyces punctatus DAOM BR117]KND00420.1 lysosomal Cystine transporter [Spizellomyces punctatus DAOM BR117]|eukprot:XP_016608459.1 lysosomal Cystine transporter [Spizellomyces punctatus DAOM BR117]
MPSNEAVWPLLSQLIGWGYFAAWSLSFYPQLVLNWRRRSVEGLSLDFLALNLWGFLCYSIYNVGLYVNRDKWGLDNSVQLNDVVFAIHACILTALTALQSFIYHRSEGQKVSMPSASFIVITASTACVAGLLAFKGIIPASYSLYYLSYIKMAITLIKYVPQAYLNFKRQSTVGWSIDNILLDLTGGVLSMMQSLIDASVSGDWSDITKNPVKFGLGLTSMSFDGLFIVQHYVLYRNRVRGYGGPNERDEVGPLLSAPEEA